MTCRQRLMTCTLLLGVLPTGCATSAPKDPLSTVQRYLELTSGDHKNAAYELLSDSFRRSCDLPCYARLASSQHDDAQRALTDLRLGGAAHTERTVELTLDDGTSLRLAAAEDRDAGPPSLDRHGPARSPGPYRFTQNPLEFYPQSTPEEAVRSFVRALHARRYQAVLRFVPKALSEQLTVEQLQKRFEGPTRASLLAQLAALQRHWNEPFQVDGPTAHLPTGEGQEVRLVLEQGRWRVAQLQ